MLLESAWRAISLIGTDSKRNFSRSQERAPARRLAGTQKFLTAGIRGNGLKNSGLVILLQELGEMSNFRNGH